MIFPVPGFSSDGTFSIFMVEAGAVGVDGDLVGVAIERGVGPDLEPGAVRSDSGEAERGGDVDVGRKSGRPLARGSLEHPEGGVQVFDGDAVLLQIGGAGQRARRLAGDHPHLGDLALGRRPDRVQPEQRAGGEHDAGAGLARAADQVVVHQQRGAAHRDQGPAGLDRAGGDFGEGGFGHALDDDVRELRQGRRVHYRDAGRHPFHPRSRFGEVAARHRGQLQPLDAGRERADHRQPDGAEPGDGDALRGPAHSAQNAKRAEPFSALIRPAEAPGKWAGRITVSLSA